MRQARLYPKLPPEGKAAWCFYPMSKRRNVDQNYLGSQRQSLHALRPVLAVFGGRPPHRQDQELMARRLAEQAADHARASPAIAGFQTFSCISVKCSARSSWTRQWATRTRSASVKRGSKPVFTSKR